MKTYENILSQILPYEYVLEYVNNQTVRHKVTISVKDFLPIIQLINDYNRLETMKGISNRDVQSLKQDVERWKEGCDSRDHQIEQLKGKITEYQNEIRDLKNSKTVPVVTEVSKEAFEKRLTQMEQTHVREIEAMKKKLHDAEVQAKQLQLQNENQKLIIQGGQKKIESLKKDLEERDSKIAELEESLKSSTPKEPSKPKYEKIVKIPVTPDRNTDITKIIEKMTDKNDSLTDIMRATGWFDPFTLCSEIADLQRIGKVHAGYSYVNKNSNRLVGDIKEKVIDMIKNLINSQYDFPDIYDYVCSEMNASYSILAMYKLYSEIA